MIKAGAEDQFMSDPSRPKASDADKVQAELREIAALLRQASHLDPATQKNLADVVEELSRAIKPDALPSAETIHLAQTLAQLARSLHAKEERSRLTSVAVRLRAAVAKVEVESSF